VAYAEVLKLERGGYNSDLHHELGDSKARERRTKIEQVTR
jgi:hypothetical protein